MGDQRLRVAIVHADRCKPTRCGQECKRHCPVQAQGKLCVDASKQGRTARISETLCVGCGICAKKCPFDAIQIVNLPTELKHGVSHRYGLNAFRLHRLPMPQPGRVLGLLGRNGTGKSTALGVLAGRIQPNLGRYDDAPDWKSIIAHFRGSQLQAYFARLSAQKLKAAVKPQYIERFAAFEQFPERASVGDILAQRDTKGAQGLVAQQLEITHLLEREVADLSGGELQRFAIAVLCVQQADVYVVDEPSAYLDIRQRLRAAHAIRGVLRDTGYVLAVEHDLAVLDYLSDQVCCLWGSPGAYGAVTAPYGSSEGINHFLAGFLPTENLRIREEALSFRLTDTGERVAEEREPVSAHTHLVKCLGSTRKGGEVQAGEGGALGGSSGFQLEVEPGSVLSSEVIVLLGENGTGKTTLIQMLAGRMAPDSGEMDAGGRLSVSLKPQMFTPSFEGTVRELLRAKVGKALSDPQFQSDVVRPLMIPELEHLHVKTLSGGELQRVALALSLGRPADVYLIDEPSAYLDVEQRVAAARVLRRFVLGQKKTAFVVEHDFVMATYLADRVIVFDGQPGVACRASAPLPVVEGMNQFLSQLGVTFRRDVKFGRPRINKIGGAKDREQKQAGNYYLLEQP